MQRKKTCKWKRCRAAIQDRITQEPKKVSYKENRHVYTSPIVQSPLINSIPKIAIFYSQPGKNTLGRCRLLYKYSTQKEMFAIQAAVLAERYFPLFSASCARKSVELIFAPPFSGATNSTAKTSMGESPLFTLSAATVGASCM